MLNIEDQYSNKSFFNTFFSVSFIDDKFSVFKTEIEAYGSPTETYSLHLFSASTSERFSSFLKGKETSVHLGSFPGESCTFDVKKETDGRILTYTADKGDSQKKILRFGANSRIVLSTTKIGNTTITLSTMTLSTLISTSL